MHKQSKLICTHTTHTGQHLLFTLSRRIFIMLIHCLDLLININKDLFSSYILMGAKPSVMDAESSLCYQFTRVCSVCGKLANMPSVMVLIADVCPFFSSACHLPHYLFDAIESVCGWGPLTDRLDTLEFPAVLFEGTQ